MGAKDISPEVGRVCGNCVFGHPMSEPGAKPEIPPEPSREGFWGWLLGGEDLFEVFERTYPLTRWRIRKERFDTLVWCRRFPDEVEKSKASTCGEFCPRQLSQDQPS